MDLRRRHDEGPPRRRRHRPGAPTNFRVRAKDDSLSAASPVAPVYSEASTAPFLRLAA